MSDEAPKPRKPRAKKAAESPDAAAPKPRVRKASLKSTQSSSGQSSAALTAERAAVQAAAKPAAAPRFAMRLVLVVAAGIVILDQLLKYIVVHILKLDRVREIDLIDPWLNLRMAWNQGVNFGLFSSNVDVMRWVLVAVAVAVCGWVWVWLMRSEHSKFAQISAGFLIGGALGNVIDRITYGAVADFLNMSLPNWRNPYSFNVADIAIFIGAIGLFLQPPAQKEQPAELGAGAGASQKAGHKARDDASK